MNRNESKLISYLIATKVKGWRNITKTGKASAISWYDRKGEATHKIHQYRPTEDYNQALDLLQEFESYTLAASTEGHFCELWNDQDIAANTEAETIGLAICLAVMDAHEIHLQDYNDPDDLLMKDVVPADGTLHTHCLRCNRPLKSKKSQIAGYGPGCAKKEFEQPNPITLLTHAEEVEATDNFFDEIKRQREPVAG